GYRDVWWSRLADRIDHRGSDRFLGALAGPDHELEGGEEALALADRDVDQILDLLDAGAEQAAQQHALAKGGRIIAIGQIEMPEPQPLIHRGQQLIDRPAAGARHLHLETAGVMQRVHLALPDEKQAVIAPTALDLDDHLFIARAVMRPLVGLHDLLHEIDRIG